MSDKKKERLISTKSTVNFVTTTLGILHCSGRLPYLIAAVVAELMYVAYMYAESCP